MFFLENNFNNDLEDHNNINVEYKIASYPLYGKYDGYGRIIFDKHLKFDNLLIFVNKILLNKINRLGEKHNNEILIKDINNVWEII